jgi:type VI secretion system protein ImpK
VEEDRGRTVVTLLARTLFASGSADVNPIYADSLQRLTKALNEVPGRVLVVGHTDDQRLRSLRFQDNFELSRERAMSVVRLLEQTLQAGTQLSWTGVGSTEPRYRPESDPENQARNRRVEIIHMSGS